METSVSQWRSGVRASAKALGWQQALCGRVRAAQAVLYSEFTLRARHPWGLWAGVQQICVFLIETGWRQRGNEESGQDKECF